ncbi:RDD family protein [Alteribacter populi]|uniref:RDD family protein n=1 Tax=Alteribacter populi TaxID=2011011 RepID=UPI000BBB1DF3|nr:RDD family protein [Alteribacter populi]
MNESHSNSKHTENEDKFEQQVYEQENEEVAEVHYGGFWMRFWAYLVDLLVVSSINGVVVGIFLTMIGLDNLTFGIYSLAGLMTALVSYSYFVIMTKLIRQTLGKRIFGLLVISESEDTLTWGDVVFREVVGRFIHRSLLITNLLYFIVPFDSRKRGLHDKFADTAVVLEPRTPRT